MYHLNTLVIGFTLYKIQKRISNLKLNYSSALRASVSSVDWIYLTEEYNLLNQALWGRLNQKRPYINTVD